MNKTDELFIQLVAIFQSSALQGMGKIKNPVTNAVEQNHEQATHAISMLDMLREKTQGNLSDSLQRTLSQVISELKLNFSELK